jgi:starch synthase
MAMKVVFATSEMAPFAKTGGLADVSGSLPAALADQGMDVKVFMPKYKAIDRTKYVLTERVKSITVAIGDESITGTVYECEDYHEGVNLYFVEQKDYFERDGLYGDADGDYHDNDKRFIFFQKVILETVRQLECRPDIIHCNDWQTALLPIYIKENSNDAYFDQTKSVLTIHNLAYQGIFDKTAFDRTGLPRHVFSPDGVEFYGRVNFIKGGILYADSITTVSKRYADEIQLTDFGCGLEGVIRARADRLHGIVNGIDFNEWNSATDRDITVNFTSNDLDKKYINKGVLQKENGLTVDRDIPLIGMVCRLVDQKGLDIIEPILDDIARLNLQLVILGTGDAQYHVSLNKLAEEYPKKVSVNILFDEQMAKRIYAGSDIFLMPSLFEPCGLGQLIAYRFATVPLVRQTGGLADTVTDFNKHSQTGTGFVFSDYSSHALLNTIKKAITYYKDRSLWKKIIQNAQSLDYSWTASASKYIELYESAQKKSLINI